MPEALTWREDVLAAYEARLQAIRTASGFLTDAGTRVVVLEHPAFGPDDGDFAIVVMPGDTEVQYVGEHVSAEWPIEIQAIVRVGLTDGWRLLEWLLADVKKAIELPDRTLGGLIKAKPGIRRGAERVLPREDGSAVLGLGITYRQPLIEPWGGFVAVEGT